MAAAPPPAIGPPAAIPQVALPGLPMWEQLFTTADLVFTLPAVPYAMLSTTIFN